MKTMKIVFGIALALTFSLAATLKAQDIYVSNGANGTIGEYGLDGSTVNASLISGLNNPYGIAISGNDLFVARGDTTFEYTTAGVTVNTSLITRLAQLSSIAVSGNDLFVGDVIRGIICKYTTTGATIAAPLITGMTPAGIAIWHNDLFVVDTENGCVYKFGTTTTPGTTVTKYLILGLNAPTAIAVAPVP